MDLMAEFIQTEFIDKVEKRAPVAPMFDEDLPGYLVEDLFDLDRNLVVGRVYFDTDEDIAEDLKYPVWKTVPTLRYVELVEDGHVLKTIQSDELTKDQSLTIYQWLEEFLEGGA